MAERDLTQCAWHQSEIDSMRKAQVELVRDTTVLGKAMAGIEAELVALTERIPLTLAVDVAGLVAKVSSISTDLHDLKTIVKQEYVTRAEFEPVKSLVDKVVWLVISAVVIAVLGLVFARGIR